MAELVRLFLHDDGEGIEGVWGKPTARDWTYEIVSVPFLHMSPTCGDVVEARPDPIRGNELIYKALVKKGGRWVAVYNWFPHKGGTVGDVLARLDTVAKKNDLVLESCLEPLDGAAGCIYIASPKAVSPTRLDDLVDGAGAPADFDRVLPVNVPPSTLKAAAKKPAAKKPAKKKAKPAKKKAKAKPAKKKAKAKPFKKKAKAKPAKKKAKPAKKAKRRR